MYYYIHGQRLMFSRYSALCVIQNTLLASFAVVILVLYK